MLATIATWTAVILAPFFVVGLVNIYRHFRCPECGRVHPYAWVMMALLPVGLFFAGLVIPVIGLPIMTVALAVRPRQVLDVDIPCAGCAESVRPVNLVGRFALS